MCLFITTRQTADLPLFQAEVWFTIAEVFLGEEMIPDAQKCVDEIKILFPLSHLVSYMQGLIKEKEGTHHDHELDHELDHARYIMFFHKNITELVIILQ